METTYVFVNRQMNKEDVVYINTMEYYAATRRKEILPFAARWMDLEGIMLSEISQTEKDKYWMLSLLYVESKKAKCGLPWWRSG